MTLQAPTVLFLASLFSNLLKKSKGKTIAKGALLFRIRPSECRLSYGKSHWGRVERQALPPSLVLKYSHKHSYSLGTTHSVKQQHSKE